MKSTSRWFGVLVAVAAAAMMTSCRGEATESAAPVQLVVTHFSTFSRIDLLGGNCEDTFGAYTFQTIQKNPNLTGQFTDVRITRYRVSYVRTDGGTAVPAPYVNATNFLVGLSGTSGEAINTLRSDAFLQAPFVALRPTNGGRDPETGRSIIRMDVIVEFFGETLGGDAVYATSRHPLEFCYDCNGCA